MAMSNKKFDKKKLIGTIDPNAGNYENHPFFLKKKKRQRHS
jgi:hypothetical protein